MLVSKAKKLQRLAQIKVAQGTACSDTLDGEEETLSHVSQVSLCVQLEKGDFGKAFQQLSIGVGICGLPIHT